MILSDSLLGVEIFDLMIRVDSKQNVGNISLNITKIKLLITLGPSAEVLIASVILLQIVIKVVGPQTHFVKNHAPQSRTNESQSKPQIRN